MVMGYQGDCRRCVMEGMTTIQSVRTQHGCVIDKENLISRIECKIPGGLSANKNNVPSESFRTIAPLE